VGRRHGQPLNGRARGPRVNLELNPFAKIPVSEGTLTTYATVRVPDDLPLPSWSKYPESGDRAAGEGRRGTVRSVNKWVDLETTN